jgi:hypothetical protein
MWDALERARERAAATYYDYGVTRPGVISQGAAIQQMGNMGTGPASKQTAAEEVAPGEEVEGSEAVEGDEGVDGSEAMPVTPESSEPATTERTSEKSLLGSSFNRMFNQQVQAEN